MQRQSGWKNKSKEEIKEILLFSEEYKEFLDRAKTEREAAAYIERYLKIYVFQRDYSRKKVYAVNRGKEVIAYVAGKEGPRRDLILLLPILMHQDSI